MWPEMFEFLSTVIAAACCSAAVKLADDYLDMDYDAIAGKPNWAEILDRGTMLYAMFLLALAAGINATLSLSLFFASYIVGMFSCLRDKFPSRLNGFQESMLAFTAGIILFGWNQMMFSVCFVAAVQLFDDYLDAQSDQLAGQRNLANRLGKVECIVVFLLCTILAWDFDNQLFFPALAGTTIVYLLSSRLERVQVW
ncbi:hypothetical protein [Sporomusa aerivorans]|uniref:hypothetical protein n=1 Tax=Sporomusa aerivorans TaxID=204936 RepID=UPI00352B17BA